MKAVVTEPKSYQRVVSIEIPAEEVAAHYGKTLDKRKKEIKLPGFRPGKVPANVIEKRFGDALRVEAIDELMNDAYRKALTDNKITPVSEPVIRDVVAQDSSKPVTFVAEVEVDPVIEVKNWRKVKVKVDAVKVKDSDVDKTVEEIRERMSEIKDLDRPSAKGDVLFVNYPTVTVDGEIIADYKPAPQMLTLGSSPFKEFDKELTGLSVGDSKTVSLKFPKDHRDADLAGKNADIVVTVTKVGEKIVPEFTPEVLEKVGGFKTVEELKNRVREDMEKGELQKAKSDAYDKAIDAILEKNDFEVPPSRVAYYLEKVAEEEGRYYPNGKLPETEKAALAEKHTAQGIRALKRYRVIDFIAAAEKVKATQEEVDARITEIADYYGQPFEEVKKVLRQNGTAARIREEVKEQKVLDMLIGVAEWPEAEKQ